MFTLNAFVLSTIPFLIILYIILIESLLNSYQRLLINFRTSIKHLSFILHMKLRFKVIYISTYYMKKLICKLCLKIPPT